MLVERRRRPPARINGDYVHDLLADAGDVSNRDFEHLGVVRQGPNEMPANSTVPRTMIGATTGAAVGLPSSGVGYGVIGRGVGAGIGTFVDGSGAGFVSAHVTV